MWRTATRGALIGAVLTHALLLTGCGLWPGDGSAKQTTEPDTSARGFQQFSGVDLPEGVDKPKVSADTGKEGSTTYTVRFTSSPERAAGLCKQIGNWLLRPEGVPKDDRKKFGISPQEVDQAGEVRGCDAFNQETGTQNEGIVLYPDNNSATVYLYSAKLSR